MIRVSRKEMPSIRITKLKAKLRALAELRIHIAELRKLNNKYSVCPVKGRLDHYLCVVLNALTETIDNKGG